MKMTETEKTEARALTLALVKAENALRTYQAPPLTVENGELLCPWCKEIASADNLYDWDISHRWTYPNEIDGDNESPAFNYDGYGDYESVALMHESCNLPVAPPEGWEMVC